MAKKRRSQSEARPTSEGDDRAPIHQRFLESVLQIRAAEANLRRELLQDLVDRWEGIDASVDRLLHGRTIGESLLSDLISSGTAFGRDCLSSREIRAIQQGDMDAVRWPHVEQCAACKAFVNAVGQSVNDPFRTCIKPERFAEIAEGKAIETSEVEHSRQCLLCSLLLQEVQGPDDPLYEDTIEDVRAIFRRLAGAKGQVVG